MACITNIEKHRKHIAEDFLYIFLAGLDHNLDQISSPVLATFPLPSLEEAYSLIRHEAKRQVTTGTKDHSEVSTMVVHKNNTQTTSFTPTNSSSRFCTH